MGSWGDPVGHPARAVGCQPSQIGGAGFRWPIHSTEFVESGVFIKKPLGNYRPGWEILKLNGRLFELNLNEGFAGFSSMPCLMTGG